MTPTKLSRFLLLIIGLCLITLFFIGCRSASDHLRLAKKHLLLAESKGAKIAADTVYKTITVTVPEKHFDTVVHVQHFRDTVFVKGKNGVIVKWKYDTITKKVFVDCKCPEVKKEEKVPVVVKTNIEAPWTDFFTDLIPWWLWIIIAIVVIVIFGSRVAKWFINK